LVHPKAKHAKINKFPILELHGQPISKPEDDAFWPHKNAIEWHKAEVFDKFNHEVRKVIGVYFYFKFPIPVKRM